MPATCRQKVERAGAGWIGPGARPHLYRREVPERFPVGARLPPLVLTPPERAELVATYFAEGPAAALAATVRIANLQWRSYIADLAGTLAWRSARPLSDGGRHQCRVTVPARGELVAMMCAELTRAEEARRRLGRRIIVALAEPDPPPAGTAVMLVHHPHTGKLVTWDLAIAAAGEHAPPAEDWSIPDALEVVRGLRAAKPSASAVHTIAAAERQGVRRSDARAALRMLGELPR